MFVRRPARPAELGLSRSRKITLRNKAACAEYGYRPTSAGGFQNATRPTDFKVAFEGRRGRQFGHVLEAGRVFLRGTVASEAWADEQAGDKRTARWTCCCATRCGRPGSRSARATPIPARMATARKADWKPSVRATSRLAP